MSKPRKDRSTPTGSSPVDIPGADDTSEPAAQSAAGSTKKTTARGGTDTSPSTGTSAKAGAKAPKTGGKNTAKPSAATAADALAEGRKKSTSRPDAAEEFARRTTAQKVRVSGGDNPVWWVPVMCGLMLLGLLWLVVTYLAQGSYPAPKIGVVWNLGVGFVLVMAGFLMTTRWK